MDKNRVDDLEGLPLYIGDKIWDKASGLQVTVFNNDMATWQGLGGKHTSYRRNGCWTRTTPEDWKKESLEIQDKIQAFILNHGRKFYMFTIEDILQWFAEYEHEIVLTTNKMIKAKLLEVEDGRYRIKGDEIATSLYHPLNEDALDTIDALMCSGAPTIEDMSRLQYFFERWSKRLKESRDIEIEIAENPDEE